MKCGFYRDLLKSHSGKSKSKSSFSRSESKFKFTDSEIIKSTVHKSKS